MPRWGRASPAAQAARHLHPILPIAGGAGFHGARAGGRLADALVAQVRARGEGALLQQPQAHLFAAGGEVRLAAADRDRVDPGAELVDQVEQRGGEFRPADFDMALMLARETRHLGGRVGAAHDG